MKILEIVNFDKQKALIFRVIISGSCRFNTVIYKATMCSTYSKNKSRFEKYFEQYLFYPTYNYSNRLNYFEQSGQN